MKPLISNKRARFDYEILEVFEAGIELLGYEVKSLRSGRGQMQGAYVQIIGNEAFLVGVTIPPYQPNNTPESYDPERDRRLLLHKTEVNQLIGAKQERGLTIVPLSMYNKRGRVKVEIGLARGKKKHDKREAIKRRDTERDIERTFKTRLS